MAEDRRSSRSQGSGASRGGPRSSKPTGGRGGQSRGGSGNARSGSGSSSAPRKRTGSSSAPSGGKPYGDRKASGGKSYGDRKPGKKYGDGPSRSSKPEQRRAPAGRYDKRAERPTRAERTADQQAYDGPDLPPEITGKELDRSIAHQLKGLPEKLAARIARHLVAAGMYIDDDPELAYQHAKAAKSRAQRIAVVREALGEAAYAAGHYAEALAELRAAKRMNGATAYLPIMADCHRALGQPEQALKLAQSPSVRNFVPEAKAEMTIVEAGARRDLGQLDAALRTLEMAPLQHKTRDPWVVRLRYAYADTLAAAGRHTEALTWFHRTHAIDADEITDAEARAAEIEKQLASE